MNSTTGPSYPGWIPEDFQIPPNSGQRVCKAPGDALLNLGIFNIVTIVIFLVSRNQRLRAALAKCVGKRPPRPQRPWSFVNVGILMPFQIVPMILSSYFTSNSTVYIWRNLQIWSVRPRVTWFKGNMAQINREWGYMNDALSSVVVELFICSFSTYFVGNLLHRTLFYAGPDKTGWTTVMWAACMGLMISTAVEVLWGLYMCWRLCYTRGQAEPDDMDSLKWIARTFVPVTCICSWLIWAAYLYSSPEAYCPVRTDYITAVWIVAPFLASATQFVVDRFR